MVKIKQPDLSVPVNLAKLDAMQSHIGLYSDDPEQLKRIAKHIDSARENHHKAGGYEREEAALADLASLALGHINDFSDQ